MQRVSHVYLSFFFLCFPFNFLSLMLKFVEVTTANWCEKNAEKREKTNAVWQNIFRKWKKLTLQLLPYFHENWPSSFYSMPVLIVVVVFLLPRCIFYVFSISTASWLLVFDCNSTCVLFPHSMKGNFHVCHPV